jgi:hypothetical protein
MTPRPKAARGHNRCSNDALVAWARPRRKRNGDGEVPLKGLIGVSRSAHVFLSDPIETREALLKDHP